MFNNLWLSAWVTGWAEISSSVNKAVDIRAGARATSEFLNAWDDWSPGNIKAAKIYLKVINQSAVYKGYIKKINKYIRSTTDNHVDAVERIVAEAVETGTDATRLLKKKIPQIAHVRAQRIAMTEVNRAYSAGKHVGAIEGGVQRKEWLTSHSNVCPICADNESEGLIKIKQSFSSGDDTTPAHVQCLCAVGYE